eukprot:scaffold13440_cov134-Isochrysis_galbana.AAC.2
MKLYRMRLSGGGGGGGGGNLHLRNGPQPWHSACEADAFLACLAMYTGNRTLASLPTHEVARPSVVDKRKSTTGFGSQPLRRRAAE